MNELKIISSDNECWSNVRPEGELGTAHFDFKVAHKGGEPCPICGNTIERVLVQNRGTYFCPGCQPLGRGLWI